MYNFSMSIFHTTEECAEKLLSQAKAHYPAEDVKQLEQSVDYAIRHHDGQKRKSGEDFITHPLSVALLLIEWKMDIDTVIGGVLHDTVEDTEATLKDIECLFGKDVAFLVDGVTKISIKRSGMRDLDSYLPETKDNLTKLMLAVSKDIRVIIIKLADRTHNMSTLQHMTPEKQRKIARETLEIFAQIADKINMSRVRVILEDLSFKFLMPQAYNRTHSLMDSRLKAKQKQLTKVRSNVQRHLKKEGLEFRIEGRVKSVYSLYKKLDKVGGIDNVYDLIALRVVVKDVDDCYLVLSELNTLYKPVVDRIKDYIAKPKANGYQSLHTTVLTPDGKHVEFQVRTEEMHEYAERGVAATFHYHAQKDSDDYKKRKIASKLPSNLKWISDLQKAAAEATDGNDFVSEKFSINLFRDRIFVYSPKGDIYDLPKDSYPLDFAYRIHSELAFKASGFLVNGTMKPFDYKLSDGDRVEIITNKNNTPKPNWTNLVNSSHASTKLKSQLRQIGLLQPANHNLSISIRKSEFKKSNK